MRADHEHGEHGERGGERRTRRGPALGVLIPCRNEARVIERKLRNLARCAWPTSPRPHRVVVVDDGSDDGTAGWVRVAAQRHFDAAGAPVEVRVVANDLRPGKPGAVARGLRELSRPGGSGACVDLIVLTDADVVLSHGSLQALAAAFASEPALAMACGAQRFVHHLPEDGSAPDPERNPAAGPFDRLTARLRGIESRLGRLFSVHGQLLAWRAELAIEPSPGIAADDLDLVLQVRRLEAERRRTVRRCDRAVFFEVKPTGEAAAEQGLRRARAYVQALRAERPGGEADLLARLQAAFYRRVPLWSPELAFGAGLALPLGIAAWRGPAAGALLLVAFVLFAFTRVGRRLRRWLGLVRRARRVEGRERMNERWEMARG